MVCLTFDDGLPCHYKAVIPGLNRRGMRGPSSSRSFRTTEGQSSGQE